MYPSSSKRIKCDCGQVCVQDKYKRHKTSQKCRDSLVDKAKKLEAENKGLRKRLAK